MFSSSENKLAWVIMIGIYTDSIVFGLSDANTKYAENISMILGENTFKIVMALYCINLSLRVCCDNTTNIKMKYRKNNFFFFGGGGVKEYSS